MEPLQTEIQYSHQFPSPQSYLPQPQHVDPLPIKQLQPESVPVQLGSDYEEHFEPIRGLVKIKFLKRNDEGKLIEMTGDDFREAGNDAETFIGQKEHTRHY